MEVISQYDPGGCADHLGLRLPLDLTHFEDEVAHEGLKLLGRDAHTVTVG